MGKGWDRKRGIGTAEGQKGMGKTNGMGLEAGAEWKFLPQVLLLLLPPSPHPP